MTAEVFTSASVRPDEDIPNVLSIEADSAFEGDTETGLVRVDTNYKPDRTGHHPVDLSLVDALKAAAALVRAVMNGYHMSDDVDAAELLRASQDVDGDLHDLRTVLLREVRNIEPRED
jgi:hypothetical protein